MKGIKSVCLMSYTCHVTASAGPDTFTEMSPSPLKTTKDPRISQQRPDLNKDLFFFCGLSLPKFNLKAADEGEVMTQSESRFNSFSIHHGHFAKSPRTPPPL